MIDLRPITIQDANAVVRDWHRHNKPVLSARFAIGAECEGQLVGVAIVGRPVARMLQDGYTAEVVRTCVVDGAPKGTCSKLYAACWRAWRAMGGRKLVTYTLETESGASLRGAGWKIVGQVAPSKGWARKSMSHLNREYQPISGQQKLRGEIE